MDKKQLKDILAKHELWLKGDVKGVRANLSGADLSGADLSGADLSGANLSGADLSWANLRGANLRGADLSRADLIEANLIEANLSRAYLSGANLNFCTGNMREVKSLQIERWGISYTKDTLQIGCQNHPIEKWVRADPRWIAAMDSEATAWWAKFGCIILSMIDASPAK